MFIFVSTLVVCAVVFFCHGIRSKQLLSRSVWRKLAAEVDDDEDANGDACRLEPLTEGKATGETSGSSAPAVVTNFEAGEYHSYSTAPGSPFVPSDNWLEEILSHMPAVGATLPVLDVAWVDKVLGDEHEGVISSGREVVLPSSDPLAEAAAAAVSSALVQASEGVYWQPTSTFSTPMMSTPSSSAGAGVPLGQTMLTEFTSLPLPSTSFSDVGTYVKGYALDTAQATSSTPVLSTTRQSTLSDDEYFKGHPFYRRPVALLVKSGNKFCSAKCGRACGLCLSSHDTAYASQRSTLCGCCFGEAIHANGYCCYRVRSVRAAYGSTRMVGTFCF